ncbi:MAG: thioredoxin family protein [Lutibacter sp.]|nr:thioredoxin family protein [Lutibacter sp.]MDT8416315.1 thioredoxin family protein [Lutibacter sp.]
MSIKTIIIAGIAFLSIYGSYSYRNADNIESLNSDGIHFFKGTFSEALIEAKKQDKFLFMNVYATWCIPCKHLKETTFKDEKAGAYFNSNFINVSIDADSREGKKIVDKYAVRGYPTLLILDARGNLIARNIGIQSPKKLINFGKQILQ